MISASRKKNYSLNIHGRLWNLDQPKVMGILNLTPDSFYDGGKFITTKDLLIQTEKMLHEGADLIDLGAMSSRPFSKELPVEEELKRLQNALPDLLKNFPSTIFSIDTYRSPIAQYALNQGVAMINDITAGTKDEEILKVAKSFNAPYIAMHMQGSPNTMQHKPEYQNVITDVFQYFGQRLIQMKKEGISDIILDVGFGFGKSIRDNFTLLKHLSIFQELDCPLLVGISRKSMIYKSLDTDPENALNGTTALHFEALRNGAQILRVHDVKEAKEVVRLYVEYEKA
jgi:dihydropteroate synthase